MSGNWPGTRMVVGWAEVVLRLLAASLVNWPTHAAACRPTSPFDGRCGLSY